MAKQLTFTYDGKDYTLEFTRRTVAEMEKKGFIASDITDKPMTTLPALFAGAFLAHHRFVKEDIINDIPNLPRRKTLSASWLKCTTSRFWLSLRSLRKPRETWTGQRLGKWFAVLH